MEASDKPVQNSGISASKEVKTKRSQAEKIGRLKYNQQRLKQTLTEIKEVKVMLRTIFAGLKDSFDFEKPLIERIACQDEVDQEILRLLYEAGSTGLLQKDLQEKLKQIKVTRLQIS